MIDSANPISVTAAAAPGVEPEPRPDQTTWRRRAHSVRQQIENARQQIDALQRPPHKDPREEAKIEALRQRARESLAASENELRLFVIEAELAKVPMAWIQ
jgi:hypothetical protein